MAMQTGIRHQGKYMGVTPNRGGLDCEGSTDQGAEKVEEFNLMTKYAR